MKERITLDHGSGGLASRQLVEGLFLKYLKSPLLKEMQDATVLSGLGNRIAFSTDSFVVDPLFFPGGSIGELAVNGTINDLAMRGADPLCLSLGLIIEEGLETEVLERVLDSISTACEYAGVPIVTGDTKVVPRGGADKLYINTSGIGKLSDDTHISPDMITVGDVVIVSGSIANHGMTILASREGLDGTGNLKSDTCPLHHLVRAMLSDEPYAVHAMRDPTRGGLGTALAELAASCGLCIEIEEAAIPVEPEVRAMCELTGLDPLYLANEGRCIAIVDAQHAEKLVSAMKSCPQGRGSTIIGRVSAEHPGRVVLSTTSGGTRLVDALSGEPLPRIC